MQVFFDDSDKDVSCDRDPYLRLDGIFADFQKGFDTQMLLDPFEEQFDLLALLVKRRDYLRLECEIVGQKDDALAGIVLDDDTSQCRWIVLAGIKSTKFAPRRSNRDQTKTSIYASESLTYHLLT